MVSWLAAMATCLATKPSRQRNSSTSPAVEIFARDRHEMTQRGVRERLLARRLGPIRRIRRRRLRLVADASAPDAAHQAQTIAADAFQRRLMAIARADPGARLGDDGRAGERCGHVMNSPCPGRDAARSPCEVPLRRTGTTVASSPKRPGLRLCSAPLRKCCALRCIRGTRLTRPASAATATVRYFPARPVRVADDEIVAGDQRKAAEIVGVGEARAAGGKALVAAGGDREGVAGRDRFRHRLPQRQPRVAGDKPMLLDLDRKAVVGAAAPGQAPAENQRLGKPIEAGGHEDRRAFERASPRRVPCSAGLVEVDLAPGIAEIGAAFGGVEPAALLRQQIGEPAQLGGKRLSFALDLAERAARGQHVSATARSSPPARSPPAPRHSARRRDRLR